MELLTVRHESQSHPVGRDRMLQAQKLHMFLHFFKAKVVVCRLDNAAEYTISVELIRFQKRGTVAFLIFVTIRTDQMRILRR